MTIVRYNPWGVVNELQNEMNRLFETRLGHESSDQVATADWVPPIDIIEDPQRFIILADVPGVNPATIDVHMENSVLTIRGHREIEKIEKAVHKRNERPHGTFYRRFNLPDTADADAIAATCRNGVLEVAIPKQEKVQPRKITVDG